ncbi:MAG: hypothetical protein HY812_21915 [Planctomycetes bacterium]|nr:hypothetical protein [Planctomycetota bacterium]
MRQAIGRQFVRLLDQRIAAILQAVAGVPEKRLFVPVAPGTRSLGSLAVHVSRGLLALAGQAGSGISGARGADQDLREKVLSRQEVLSRLRDAAQAARAVLGRLDASAWVAAPGGGTESEAPGALAQQALDDISFHAGQIVLIGTILDLLERERER